MFLMHLVEELLAKGYSLKETVSLGLAIDRQLHPSRPRRARVQFCGMQGLSRRRCR
jgi:hypothetical protein